MVLVCFASIVTLCCWMGHNFTLYEDSRTSYAFPRRTCRCLFYFTSTTKLKKNGVHRAGLVRPHPTASSFISGRLVRNYGFIMFTKKRILAAKIRITAALSNVSFCRMSLQRHGEREIDSTTQLVYTLEFCKPIHVYIYPRF